MESGNVHTYNMLNNQKRDLLFHSFYCLIFWLLVLDRYSMISRVLYNKLNSTCTCILIGSFKYL